MEQADVVVALIVDPPSPGVQLELGVALALGKPIIQINDAASDRIPYLNRAFSEMQVGSARNVHVIDNCSPNEWIEQLLRVLGRISKPS
jgi:nucleoside 2-deoxyribosyltransferase